MAFYISHPEVRIEPKLPVPQWSLSDIGRARVISTLAEPWVTGLQRIISSAETKAIETAELLANAAGICVEIRPDTGEIDRSSTGYVPHDRHETLADALFARPEKSASGWKRAVDAQHRIVSAVDAVLCDHGDAGHIAFVGHGGIGTLLKCALKGVAIDRQHDQSGGGHVFAFDQTTRKVCFDWTRLEDVSGSFAKLQHQAATDQPDL